MITARAGALPAAALIEESICPGLGPLPNRSPVRAPKSAGEVSVAHEDVRLIERW